MHSQFMTFDWLTQLPFNLSSKVKYMVKSVLFAYAYVLNIN